MGGCCDLDNVTPRRRLSARKMDLEHAEICGLHKYPSPGRSVDLVGTGLESDRVRAIGTTERTAMGELGEEPQWTQEWFTHPRQLRKSIPASARGSTATAPTIQLPVSG